MPTIENLTLPLLRRHEGFRSKRYRDHLGNWTVGYGFLVSGLSLSWRSWLAAGGSMSSQQAERILQDKVTGLYFQLSQYWWFQGLDSVRRAALLDMSYQLGLWGLLHFVNMLSAIGHKDWVKAHQEALDSKWAKKDTPARAEEIAVILLTGRVIL